MIRRSPVPALNAASLLVTSSVSETVPSLRSITTVSRCTPQLSTDPKSIRRTDGLTIAVSRRARNAIATERAFDAFVVIVNCAVRVP